MTRCSTSRRMHGSRSTDGVWPTISGRRRPISTSSWRIHSRDTRSTVDLRFMLGYSTYVVSSVPMIFEELRGSHRSKVVILSAGR